MGGRIKTQREGVEKMKGEKSSRAGEAAYLSNWVFNQAMNNLIRRGEILYDPKTRMYSPGANMKRPEEGSGTEAFGRKKP